MTILIIVFKVLAVILTLFVVVPISLDCCEDIAAEIVYSKRGEAIGKNLFGIALCLVALTMMMLILFGEGLLYV